MTCKHISARRGEEMLRTGSEEMPKPGYVAPSREGLVPLTIYVAPENRRALKLAALQHDKTVGEMMDEAIAWVLKKYQKTRL
jgi:hypothetical protein